MNKKSKHFLPVFWESENGIKTPYRDLSNSDILKFAADLRKNASAALFEDPNLTARTVAIRIKSINEKLTALRWELKKHGKNGKRLEKINSFLFNEVSLNPAQYLTGIRCEIKFVKEKK